MLLFFNIVFFFFFVSRRCFFRTVLDNSFNIVTYIRISLHAIVSDFSDALLRDFHRFRELSDRHPIFAHHRANPLPAEMVVIIRETPRKTAVRRYAFHHLVQKFIFAVPELKLKSGLL